MKGVIAEIASVEKGIKNFENRIVVASCVMCYSTIGLRSITKYKHFHVELLVNYIHFFVYEFCTFYYL